MIELLYDILLDKNIIMLTFNKIIFSLVPNKRDKMNILKRPDIIKLNQLIYNKEIILKKIEIDEIKRYLYDMFISNKNIKIYLYNLKSIYIKELIKNDILYINDRTIFSIYEWINKKEINGNKDL